MYAFCDYISLSVCVCVCVRWCVCVFFLYMSVFECMCMHMQVWMYLSIWVCKCICACLCERACVCWETFWTKLWNKMTINAWNFYTYFFKTWRFVSLIKNTAECSSLKTFSNTLLFVCWLCSEQLCPLTRFPIIRSNKSNIDALTVKTCATWWFFTT